MMDRAQSRFEVRIATPQAFAVATGWARDEGWNPGLADLDAFFAADPSGFLIGYRDGAPISSISVVRYDESLGFLGFYIVAPEARGEGFGMATWKAGMARLGDRTVGLDGVVAQQDNYARSGFNFIGRNIRFTGIPRLAVSVARSVKVVRVGAEHAVGIGKIDRICFGAERAAFLGSWIFADAAAARSTFVAIEDGDTNGYATVRKCVEGYKIGPLFAETTRTAEALFEACCAHAGPGATVTLDAPEANRQSVKMAEAAGLEPVFETARMYRGRTPELPWSLVYGVTSFELG